MRRLGLPAYMYVDRYSPVRGGVSSRWLLIHAWRDFVASIEEGA